MALYYYEGSHGLRPNPNDVLKWASMAANASDTRAKTLIGRTSSFMGDPRYEDVLKDAWNSGALMKSSSELRSHGKNFI